MHWLRLWETVLDSPKVHGLPPATFRAWVLILCSATRHDCGGILPPFKTLAFWLRMTDVELGGHMVTLISEGLVDDHGDWYEVHDWEHWQPTSDSSAERVRRHRAAKKATKQPRNVTPSGDVTACNVTETLPKRYGNGLDQIRSDKDQIRSEEFEILSDLSLSEKARETDPEEIRQLSLYVDQVTGGSWGSQAAQRVRSGVHTVAAWRAAWGIVAALDRLPNKPWNYAAKIIDSWPGGVPPASPKATTHTKGKAPPPTPEEEEAEKARLEVMERQILAQLGRSA